MTDFGMMGTMERDTEEREDIPNLFEFLLVSKEILNNAQCFGMHYNRTVFDGWVKQPSPCCAASSVAGAWNALHGKHRQDSDALQHTDVLQTYREIIEEKISKKVTSFERKLGALLTAEFWQDFEQRAVSFGKEWSGKKGFSITKSITEKILKAIACQHYEFFHPLQKESTDCNPDSTVASVVDIINEVNGDEAMNYKKLSAKDCLVELYLSEGETLTQLNEAESIKVESDDEVNSKFNTHEMTNHTDTYSIDHFCHVCHVFVLG
jgi:hypothetical protein